MKTHGTLFRGDMVRAMLNTQVGSWPAVPIDTDKAFKWHTRRMVKPQPVINREACAIRALVKNAPYKVGDHLWVKETFRTLYDPATCSEGALDIDYKADGIERIGDRIGILKWKSGRFMPRLASRITLEVMGVKSERLKEISDDDCWAEGITIEEQHVLPRDAYRAYRVLWESIHGKGSWDANPWVWVYELKRIK